MIVGAIGKCERIAVTDHCIRQLMADKLTRIKVWPGFFEIYLRPKNLQT